MQRRITLALVLLAVLAIAYSLFRSGPELTEPAVLVLELAGDLEEAPPTDPLAQFSARGPALPTLLLQLEKAQADERVHGVVLRIRPITVGFARIQELRDAVATLAESGKPVLALLDMASFNSTREMYLASAATRIYTVPSFLGPFSGLAGQYMQLGGLLDQIGVDFEYERIGEHKTAPEMFASTEMSDVAREQARTIIDGIFEQILRGVADGRKMTPDRVAQLIDQAPATSAEFLASGLSDGEAGFEELLAEEGLDELEQVELDFYIHVDPTDFDLRTGPGIALVFGDGTIVPGGGRGARAGSFAADSIAAALDAAAEDEEIAAIVLRINSGGGSALASDLIWRAVRRAREEKPIVISMADAAASGGYYVASAANAIVAQPATLTGSIGVYVQRPSFAGLFSKLSIGTERISRGRFSGMAALDAPLSVGQRERIRSFVRAQYDEFLERVSAGRDMPTEEVDRLGRGQVFLGETALAHGLVDAVGGLHVAIERAKLESGIDPDVDPKRLVFPDPRSLAQQLRDLVSGELRTWVAEALLPLPSWWIYFD
jgi:protease-4